MRANAGILCQGRGSAANSAVCYCLGITEVNPNKTQLLFARFISQARGEPPDIDVDFEHERREEVIQYIYRRYGRHRAAICATVIHYRSRRAIGEVGKVLGLTPDITAALSKTVWGSYGGEIARRSDPPGGARSRAIPPSARRSTLAGEITGFPRHLSQHVGGFVLTRERLDETVPIGNAAMDERTFIEWDKDDIDTLSLMKVDVLALGMLSCIRRALDMLKAHRGHQFPDHGRPAAGRSRDLRNAVARRFDRRLPGRKPRANVDAAAPQAARNSTISSSKWRSCALAPSRATWCIPICAGATASRKPHYPSPSPEFGPANELEEVLKRTFGVPLFQEQAMQIAITAAEFSPDDADGLRRAMATFRHNGNVHHLSREIHRRHDAARL